MLALLGLALLAQFWVIVPAGARGVWMRWGEVQAEIFAEGLHFVIPLVDTVQPLSIRVQKHEISAAASSKDLQDVFTEVSLNWHILPEQANVIFQHIGTEDDIVAHIITPAIAEIIKAVIARYTAEEMITRRDQVKTEVDTALTTRLLAYNLVVDDVSLINVHFSQQFREAVEAKQIAEQEAKQAEFVAQKAIRQAEIEINLAKGKAEAHRILQDTLTSRILKHQALERWDGHLPLMTGDNHHMVIDLDDVLEDRKNQR